MIGKISPEKFIEEIFWRTYWRGWLETHPWVYCDYKKYKEEILDSKSESFCGAKWFNATTWLGSGTTASCHHPPAHKIPLIEIEEDYTAIHNTKHKKEMRRMMQKGERPAECEYCWKMEDMKKNAVSDRTFKTIIYTDEELQAAYDADWNENANLKTDYVDDADSFSFMYGIGGYFSVGERNSLFSELIY